MEQHKMSGDARRCLHCESDRCLYCESETAHTPCGCTVNDGHIVSCHVHAAAPEMLEALEYLNRQPDCSDDLKEHVISPILEQVKRETLNG